MVPKDSLSILNRLLKNELIANMLIVAGTIKQI